MTRLAADRQRGLSPAVSARLVATGIGFRLMRSGVTVAVQALAVAFLVYVFAAATIDASVQRGASAALAPYRDADAWLSRLRQPDTVESVLAALGRRDADRMQEYAAWADLDDDEIGRTASHAQRWKYAQRWYAALPDDDRALLLGDQTLRDAADQLASPAARQALAGRMRERGLEPPGGVDHWIDFLGEPRAALFVTAQHTRQGHARALRDLPKLDIAGSEPDPTVDALTKAGFVASPDRLEALRPYAARRATAATLTEALQSPELRRALARRARVPINAVTLDTALDTVRDADDAAWLHVQLDTLSPDEDAPDETIGVPAADALADYTHHARTEARLADAVPPGFDPAAADAGLLGLPPRTLLLIALSCLVCVVGVANAMTMSVTERFSEIATMKCLGARSGSVMAMFLLESAALGVLGGLLGTALGLALAAAGGLVRYGALLELATTALGTLGLVTAGALALGVLLSVVAALLPSWFAARLPPIAAMRVE